MQDRHDPAADPLPDEPQRAPTDWIAGAAILLGLAASLVWCLFLLWLCYSAATWMLS